MKLSSRLKTLADLIEKYRKGEILADIGSDHAYLPCFLVGKGVVSKAYACDITPGPVKSALETVAYYHLEDRIEVLMGDGLEPILDKKVDMIAIAGMGSYLISDILEENKNYLKHVKMLFLQPNANIDHLRMYLYENNYLIVDEAIVRDGNHIYEMVVAMLDETECVCDIKGLVDMRSIEFGPILSKVQSPLFVEKWNRQYRLYNEVVKAIEKTNPRYEELVAKIRMIEEVLDENLDNR
ncbi:MAG: tRNA (adenine(22)-N(1))-methyltransferase TrmK [Erysipelotrichaceae bacterium]|nr:tRNA (adenine(22)-N(1))-methyltransferase TrmK [Erysipelotrichaceae bacterium]